MQRVIAVESVGDGPALLVYTRTEDGERVVHPITDFHPYFYRAATDDEVPDVLGLEGTPLKRVDCHTTTEVVEKRGEYDLTWEDDVPYTQRWMIDNRVFAYLDDDLNPVEDGNVEVKKLYFDIEVAEERFVKPDETGHIVAVTFGDKERFTSFAHTNRTNVGNTTLESSLDTYPWTIYEYDTEKAMLEGMRDWLRDQDFDLLLGYNSSEYDWPMIVNRCQKLEVWLSNLTQAGYVSARKWTGKQLVDLYPILVWSQLSKPDSNKLGDVAARNGLDVDKSGQTLVYPWWNDGRYMDILRYNALDVEATWYVDDAENLSGFALVLQEMLGTDSVQDVTKASVSTDVLCLREAYDRATPLPSRRQLVNAAKFKGGSVLYPQKAGAVKNVAVFDFSRLYPNIIVNFNISKENFTGERSPWGWEFSTQEPGLFPAVVGEAFKIRDYCEGKYAETQDPKWATRIQASKKLLNGCFGALGFTKFRLYHKETAETVTGASRYLLDLTKKQLDAYGEFVVYGDTDSLFVQTESPFETRKHVLAAVEGACSDMGIPPIAIDMEKIYYSILFKQNTRKRYAAYEVWKDGEYHEEPKFKVKGFEVVRSDSSDYTVEVQKHVFDMVLRGEPRADVLRYSLQAYRAAREGRVDPLRLAWTPTLTDDPDKYETNPKHVEAARYSNKWNGAGLKGGDRLRVIDVATYPEGQPPTTAIALEYEHDLPSGYTPNYLALAQKSVGNKLAKFFSSIGWMHEAATMRAPYSSKLTEHGVDLPAPKPRVLTPKQVQEPLVYRTLNDFGKDHDSESVAQTPGSKA